MMRIPNLASAGRDGNSVAWPSGVPCRKNLSRETKLAKGCPTDLQDDALGGDARTELTGEPVEDIHLTIRG